jgi:acid phosphatase family membrane protein YuiD
MNAQSEQSLKLFLQNPIFLSSIMAFIISQMFKTIITIFTTKGKKAKEIIITFIWNTGGIPSSHSALVSAMTVSTALNDGISSTVFIISMFFALVVIRDALGVRRATGLQAKSLNMLGGKISGKFGFEWYPVKEIHGHTPLEVSFGVILGVLCAFMFFILKN